MTARKLVQLLIGPNNNTPLNRISLPETGLYELQQNVKLIAILHEPDYKSEQNM